MAERSERPERPLSKSQEKMPFFYMKEDPASYRFASEGQRQHTDIQRSTHRMFRIRRRMKDEIIIERDMVRPGESFMAFDDGPEYSVRTNLVMIAWEPGMRVEEIMDPAERLRLIEVAHHG